MVHSSILQKNSIPLTWRMLLNIILFFSIEVHQIFSEFGLEMLPNDSSEFHRKQMHRTVFILITFKGRSTLITFILNLTSVHLC